MGVIFKGYGVARLLAALVLALCGLALTTGSALASPAPAGEGWFTSWAQSQQRIAGKDFPNMSLRMITRLTQGGTKVRVRMQNQFGTQPLTIPQSSVAISTAGKAIDPATHNVLTFGGNQSVTIPVGGDVWSDPVNLVTQPQDDLAVTFYVPAGSPRLSLHDRAGRTNYATPEGAGNQNSNASGSAFNGENLPWTYLVSAVDVYNEDVAGTIVAYGSSVVDGEGADQCGAGCNAHGLNLRWTDMLARRIVNELPVGEQVTIANAGINGTTVATECSGAPLDGQSRIFRDVKDLTGVTGVIIYYGTNDIANGCSSTQIINAYHYIFEQLRNSGIKIYVTPITPRPGYSGTANTHRAAVNNWVRQGGNCDSWCDGVLDFDVALRDPVNANIIYEPYGYDGIHVNVFGQQAISDSIDLSVFRNLTAPAIQTSTLADASLSQPYSAAVAASGHPAPTFTVTGGTLPAGLALNPATGAITGTPTVAGTSSFTVTASNGVGAGALANLSLTVAKAPSTLTAVASPARVVYGTVAKVEVQVEAPGAYPIGQVKVKSGDTVVGEGTVAATSSSTGEATVSLGGSALTPGSHSLTVDFDGNSQVGSSTGTVLVQVVKASPKVAIKAPASVKKSKRGKVQITVTAKGVANRAGTVTIFDGKRKVGTVKVKANGKATVKIATLKKGKRKLVAKFAGSNLLAGASSAKVTVRVV